MRDSIPHHRTTLYMENNTEIVNKLCGAGWDAAVLVNRE